MRDSSLISTAPLRYRLWSAVADGGSRSSIQPSSATPREEEEAMEFSSAEEAALEEDRPGLRLPFLVCTALTAMRIRLSLR